MEDNINVLIKAAGMNLRCLMMRQALVFLTKPLLLACPIKS